MRRIRFTHKRNRGCWGSGFAVATFHRGKLLPPELVVVQDGVAYFRGKQINQHTVKVMPQKTAKKAA